MLCYASRARLHHVHRVIFREKLLQPCPAKQAGAGVFDALLLHSGTGTAELALTLGMLHFRDLQPCQCPCSHETESSVLPDANANKKIRGGEWQERAVAVVCFSRELRGKGIWSASCCSPQCLARRTIPPAVCSSAQSKSLLTAATCWDCLMVSLHISPCPRRVFLFP